jgi:hypothetical protein
MAGNPLGVIQNDGTWYDPAAGTTGNVPVPQQPNGAGTPVTLPLQQPNDYWVSQHLPTNTPPNEKDGSIMSPCGHSIMFWEFRPDNVDGVAVNKKCCPLCGYCTQVVSPASAVFDYNNFYSM